MDFETVKLVPQPITPLISGVQRLTEQKDGKKEPTYNETTYSGTACMDFFGGQSVPCGAAKASLSGSRKNTQHSSYHSGGHIDSVECGIPGPILEICTKNATSFSGFSTTSSAGFTISSSEVLLTFLSTFNLFHLNFRLVVGLFGGFLHSQSFLVGYVFHMPPFSRLGKG